MTDTGTQPPEAAPIVPSPPLGLSVASLLLGLASLLLLVSGLGFFAGVGAVVTGHLASRRQPYAKRSWLTGLITGYVSVGLTLVFVVLFVSYLAARVS